MKQEERMSEKNQKKLDRAMKALMSMGPVPDEIDPKFTREDLDRKFRMRVDRKDRGRIEEVKKKLATKPTPTHPH